MDLSGTDRLGSIVECWREPKNGYEEGAERKKPPSAPHTCDLCLKTYSSIWSLNRHYKNLHKPKKKKTPKGVKRSGGSSNKKSYDVRFPIPCPNCSQRFKRKLHLSRHILKDHDGVGLARKVNTKVCPHCHKKLHTDNTLQLHITRVHNKTSSWDNPKVLSGSTTESASETERMLQLEEDRSQLLADDDGKPYCSTLSKVKPGGSIKSIKGYKIVDLPPVLGNPLLSKPYVSPSVFQSGPLLPEEFFSDSSVEGMEEEEGVLLMVQNELKRTMDRIRDVDKTSATKENNPQMKGSVTFQWDNSSPVYLTSPFHDETDNKSDCDSKSSDPDDPLELSSNSSIEIFGTDDDADDENEPAVPCSQGSQPPTGGEGLSKSGDMAKQTSPGRMVVVDLVSA